jgi:uncharacterized protein YabN with tetrapyrrole methylase and pyrophosphatase domain
MQAKQQQMMLLMRTIRLRSKKSAHSLHFFFILFFSALIFYFEKDINREWIFYIMEELQENFNELVQISQRLRKECPWDAEQTVDSFHKYIVGEAIEAQKAAEAKDYDELKEELGDVFWNVMFMCNIAKDNNLFDLNDIIKSAKEKMVRRHPHVFAGASKDMVEIYKKWDEVKAMEKREKEKKHANAPKR